MDFLTEENLNHWIKSKCAEEITRIQNHETKIQPHKHDSRLPVIDSRDRAKHFNTGKGFQHPLSLEGFEKWYKGRLHSVHPLGPETLDKIAESNFN